MRVAALLVLLLPGFTNVVHIDVAFPLDGDTSIKNLQFLVETKRSF